MIGAQVKMEYNGRTLLGDVRGWIDAQPKMLLRVTFFNGEPWPICPQAHQVEVLERDYEDA